MNECVYECMNASMHQRMNAFTSVCTHEDMTLHMCIRVPSELVQMQHSAMVSEGNRIVAGVPGVPVGPYAAAAAAAAVTRMSGGAAAARGQLSITNRPQRLVHAIHAGTAADADVRPPSPFPASACAR
eukprot:GHVU01040653.1.p1 GENE.GHVU01040653.1~~GHVU01040653.1.p1  ORF type:complete len:128 (+),score=17.47 GHVU01040653.1:420-803(+)